MKYRSGKRGEDYRFAIVNSNGEYLADDRHSNDGPYWTTFDDCFVLAFDTPKQANEVACKYYGALLKVFDMEDHLWSMYSEKDDADVVDKKLFQDYKKIDKMNLLEE